jgi:hypothetical protein
MSLLIGVSLVGCASADRASSARATRSADLDQAATASRVADSEDASVRVTELSFATGSDALTSNDEAKINQALSTAEASGAIKEVKVLSWSDQGYPTANATAPSDGQKSLARERNSEVANYLKSHDSKLSIKTYNMAERPNMVQELFKTEDERMKKSLELSGVSMADADDPVTSKVSKALVMVVMKQ